MRYSILGSLEVERDGERIQVDGPRQQALLATLLLEEGRLVPFGRLIDSVWDTEPPATAREQVHKCVSELRRLLCPVSPSPRIIETCPPGYMISVGGEELDHRRMQCAVSAARAASAAGDGQEAVELLRQAAALWRGPTLDGLSTRVMRAAAARLDEQRLMILEDRFDLELNLGRHRELIGELVALVIEHPVHEPFVYSLMVAFYRAGRRPDAVRLYKQIRQTYIDELGLEPGEHLRGLHRSILSADPALLAPVSRPGSAMPVRSQGATPGRLESCSMPESARFSSSGSAPSRAFSSA